MIHTLRLVMALIAVVLMASCSHREFLYELPSKRVPVVVEFDWTNDATAAPAGMTVYFYRIGSSSAKPITYDFSGREGGSLTLMPGTYSAICHNSDSDRHGFVGTHSYDEFGIRLNDHRDTGGVGANAPSIPKAVAERIAHSPDSMWVATIPAFEVCESGIVDVASRSPVVLRFDMMPVVHHYTFILRNPINFNNSIAVRATMSGMASTVHPGRGSTGDETVTHLFDVVNTPDGNLRGDFLTFGHCAGKELGTRADGDTDVPHILAVYATLADGTQWSSVHDVSEQVHNSPVADCVVRLDSIAFPSQTGAGGFSPSVGGWTGNQEIIGM